MSTAPDNTDLAASFAPPDRAAGLRKLPQRPARPGPPAESPAQTQTVRPPASSTPARKPQASSSDRLLIALPQSLRDRLRAVAQTRQVTYRDLILDAIEATIDELPQLIAAHDTTTTVNTGLFERTTHRRPASPEGTAQVTIRGLNPQNRDVLAQLVIDTGAASLTELIATALDKHLPERPRALR